MWIVASQSEMDAFGGRMTGRGILTASTTGWRPADSWTWPVVTWVGSWVPWRPETAWIFVVNPPRVRPETSLSGRPSPLSSSSVATT